MKIDFDVSIEIWGRNLSNYATKADWKWLRGADTSKLAAKADLVSLNDQIDWFQHKNYGDWKQCT